MLVFMDKKETNEPTAYHHGDLRRHLISIALEMIEESGAVELTLRGIAKRAGVSHTAPYRHFSDKEDLLTGVAREGVSLMLSEINERLDASAGDPLTRFKLCGLSYIDFAIHHPAHFRVMFARPRNGVAVPDELKPESSLFFQLFIDVISECWEQKLLQGASPHRIALSAWSQVHGFALLFINGHLHGGAMEEGSIESMKRGLLYSLYAGIRGEKGPVTIRSTAIKG